jgi:hypothetical protein
MEIVTVEGGGGSAGGGCSGEGMAMNGPAICDKKEIKRLGFGTGTSHPYSEK